MKKDYGKLLFEVTAEELNEANDDRGKYFGDLWVQPAIRRTGGSLHTEKSKRYEAYKWAIKQVATLKQFNPPERPVHVVFCLPTDKAERWNQPPQFILYVDGVEIPVGEDRHQQTPDTDNLLKGFWDAMKSKDQTVNIMIASKHWGQAGYIRVYALSDRALAELYSQK